jgi:hypothetical protein
LSCVVVVVVVVVVGAEIDGADEPVVLGTTICALLISGVIIGVDEACGATSGAC